VKDQSSNANGAKVKNKGRKGDYSMSPQAPQCCSKVVHEEPHGGLAFSFASFLSCF
jgi:hypothetical protein